MYITKTKLSSEIYLSRKVFRRSHETSIVFKWATMTKSVINVTRPRYCRTKGKCENNYLQPKSRNAEVERLLSVRLPLGERG